MEYDEWLDCLLGVQACSIVRCPHHPHHRTWNPASPLRRERTRERMEAAFGEVLR
jgi:hypothetical protein